MVLIAPSLLSANTSILGQEVRLLEDAHADLIHFDVMDGHFVPNITYGPHILKELKKHTNLPFDVHLMVLDPEKFIPWFIDAGANIITFHLEATNQPDKLIKCIQQAHLKAGVTLRPSTDMTLLTQLKEVPDLVLVMGVEPGFGGQSFYENTPDRIYKTKQLFADSRTLIEVDGGITPETAKRCIAAGADILVAGTAVFKKGSYAHNICVLKGEKQ